MHAHGTSSVSHLGSFLNTVGGVRVDCELVSSGWQLSEWCEDRGPQHGGGGADPGAGEAGKEGMVGSFFCGVGCGGVELRASRVGGMQVGKEHVEGRVGEGRGGEWRVAALSAGPLCGVCSKVLVGRAGVGGGE